MNDKRPIEESLKEDQFSSHVHCGELFGGEDKKIKGDERFFVPEKYGRDTLVLLPVNVQTQFVYWEITDNLLKKAPVNDPVLMVRLLEVDQKPQNECARFYVPGALGSHYVNGSLANKKLSAVLGCFDHTGSFFELLHSNTIVTPNDTIMASDEVWMQKSEGWEKIMRASHPDISLPLSSAALLREEELLFRLEKELINFSSNTLASKKDRP